MTGILILVSILVELEVLCPLTPCFCITQPIHNYLQILITQQYLLQLFSVMAPTIILHSLPLLLVLFFSFVPSTDISPYVRIFWSSEILGHSTYSSYATYSLTATHLLFENCSKWIMNNDIQGTNVNMPWTWDFTVLSQHFWFI